jgi:hypothetical protein
MQKKRSFVLIGLCLVPVLSACGGGPFSAPATTTTQTVTVTPSESQTEPGLLPAAPDTGATTATGTNTATETSTQTPETTATGSTTASGTESATPTGTESATSTETGTGAPTDSSVPTRPHSGPKTIRINGKNYSCSDLSVNACDKATTEALDKWGDKLEGFVNSDRLGALGKGGSAKLPDDRGCPPRRLLK